MRETHIARVSVVVFLFPVVVLFLCYLPHATYVVSIIQPKETL